MPAPSPTLRLGPPVAQARGVLILIHGRGSSPEDIAGLTQALDVGDLACLAPAAEGGAWYPQRFHAPLAQNEPWLTNALQAVAALVADCTRAGVSTERIGLIGFSQGACLALEHAVREGTRYGLIAALSGALIGPLDTPRPARDLQRTPVLLGCAEADAHIPLEHVEHSATVLEAMNAAVTKQIFRGHAHTVFPPEITWLKAQLARLGG